MATTLSDKLVVAISSTALFDLAESHEIFTKEGVQAYSDYQIEHEDEALNPGSAFYLVQKLLSLNTQGTAKSPKVEVVLVSRNSADTGLRIFNSIEAHNLAITRAAFTGGRTPYQYVSAFNAQLFLSTNAEDVRKALESGYAAATIVSKPHIKEQTHRELKVAFDGDAVLFSDEAEIIYKKQGLGAFSESEKRAAKEPLKGGPFKQFLASLHRIQQEFGVEDCPIRTALVTARSAPAHERVVRTLRSWNIRIDEAMFLGGLNKADFLKAYDADIFFDDQKDYCSAASEVVAAGHVPHGVANE